MGLNNQNDPPSYREAMRMPNTVPEMQRQPPPVEYDEWVVHADDGELRAALRELHIKGDSDTVRTASPDSLGERSGRGDRASVGSMRSMASMGSLNNIASASTSNLRIAASATMAPPSPAPMMRSSSAISGQSPMADFAAPHSFSPAPLSSSPASDLNVRRTSCIPDAYGDPYPSPYDPRDRRFRPPSTQLPPQSPSVRTARSPSAPVPPHSLPSMAAKPSPRHTYPKPLPVQEEHPPSQYSNWEYTTLFSRSPREAYFGSGPYSPGMCATSGPTAPGATNMAVNNGSRTSISSYSAAYSTSSYPRRNRRESSHSAISVQQFASSPLSSPPIPLPTPSSVSNTSSPAPPSSPRQSIPSRGSFAATGPAPLPPGAAAPHPVSIPMSQQRTASGAVLPPPRSLSPKSPVPSLALDTSNPSSPPTTRPPRFAAVTLSGANRLCGMGLPSVVRRLISEELVRAGIRNFSEVMPGVVEWTIDGNPWHEPEEGLRARRIVKRIVATLSLAGWHLMTAADLSGRDSEKDTLVFREGVPRKREFFSIAFAGEDRILIIDPPPAVRAKFVEVVRKWPRGLQDCSEKSKGCIEATLAGASWGGGTHMTCLSRLLVLELLAVMEGMGYELEASVSVNKGRKGDSASEVDSWIFASKSG